MSANLHERDFYAWTQQQSQLLRAGRLDEIDVENLIGEIESNILPEWETCGFPPPISR